MNTSFKNEYLKKNVTHPKLLNGVFLSFKLHNWAVYAFLK